MTLADLNEDEFVAFLALAKAMVRMDHSFSPDEMRFLSELRDQIGVSRFNSALVSARHKAPTMDAALELARVLQSKASQQVVYDTLQGLALSDEFNVDEAVLLDALAADWHLDQ